MAEKKNQNQGQSSTQEFLQVSEIRDNIIILKDGTLRAVLAVSSTNFDLKSEEEQNALIYSYQRFLNSLEFSIQILMQSRKMEIADYTEKLRQIMDKQTTELMRMQTAEYIDFIDRLVESANVMNKSFYVVVPYDMSVNPGTTSFFSKLFGSGKTKEIEDKRVNLETYGKQLDERVTTIENNLAGCGLKVMRLQTGQLIELIYNSYNFSAGPSIDASQLSQINIKAQ